MSTPEPSPAFPLAPLADPALVALFRSASTRSIGDSLDRLPGLAGLRPFRRSGRLLGSAPTVRVRAGDDLAI
jgi:hypothetical protein